uniref:Tensin 3 n=1 Tax=Lepisosteus oculatus TaxID=7918 RepID=W5N638_LEPOC
MEPPIDSAEVSWRVVPKARMEEGYELDLTYITECIIAVSFPRDCSEETYLSNLQDVTRMLKSKHADNYLVINLSEKRYELTKMNPKTMDTGWPDLHAPPLEKICTICKAMESWLNSDPQHVVVIHCRGGKSRIGVVISSYVHFTNISASADQALDRFAMKKFYDDKVSAIMTASQKRYVWFLNSLLTGSIKMNTSPLFLHFVILHGVPSFDTGGVCHPFLKVYQGMESVYTSGIYRVGAGYRSRICIALEPAQLLKGDVMIKCYHKRLHCAAREVVFRLQFHTGAVHGHRLVFDKEDLEVACEDDRFPDYGKIELMFSGSPEKVQGSELWQNGPGVTVDYNTADPLFRWDSLEHMSPDSEGIESINTVPHSQGPVDGNLYAKVRKKSTTDSGLAGGPQDGSVTSSPDHSDHALSISSDSGHSTASGDDGEEAAGRRPAHDSGPGPRQWGQKRQMSSHPSQTAIPDTPTRGSSSRDAVQRATIALKESNGLHIASKEEDSPASLAMDIDQSIEQLNQLIMDLDPTFVPIPTRSNSVKREGTGQDLGLLLPGVKNDHVADNAAILFCSFHQLFKKKLELAWVTPANPVKRSPCDLYLTNDHIIMYSYTLLSENYVEVHLIHFSFEKVGLHYFLHNRNFKSTYRALVQKKPCPCQSCFSNLECRTSLKFKVILKFASGHAIRVLTNWAITPFSQTSRFFPFFERSSLWAFWVKSKLFSIKSPVAEFWQNLICDSSLERSRSVLGARQSSDITESSLFSRTGWVLMEQIQHSPAYASSSQPSEENVEEICQGGYYGKKKTLKSNRSNENPSQSTGKFFTATVDVIRREKMGYRKDRCTNVSFERIKMSYLGIYYICLLSNSRNDSDLIYHVLNRQCECHNKPGTISMDNEIILRKFGQLCSALTDKQISQLPTMQIKEGKQNDEANHSIFSLTPASSDTRRLCCTVITTKCLGTRGASFLLPQEQHPRTEIPGRYQDCSISEVSSTAGPGIHISLLTIISNELSFISHTHSTAMKSDVTVTASSCQRPYVSTNSPLPQTERRFLAYLLCITDSTGAAWVLLRGFKTRMTPRSPASRGPRTLSAPDNGSLEHSFLTAVEGLSQPSPAFRHAGVNVQPPLPEKKRISEGEHSIGSASPSLSGFSSPHSGSTISIPFPSVLPDFSQVLSTSPIPDAIPNKQVTVKFVQDTSKFWYKPDISRDQAIAILKDKEPGSFIVRDSHSFRGAYGLAMKVATPPPSVLQQSKKAWCHGDSHHDIIGHFLVKSGLVKDGAYLGTLPNYSSFVGSLTALVCQHSITPLALPCKLIIPDRDPLEDIGESNAHMATNSAAELLKQGAVLACNVWYLGSVEMESLTGTQAVHKATSVTLNPDTPTTSTVVHFKVSAQGITLTDNQRKLFFRRHYAVNTVIFCALDPQDRRWTKDGCSSAKIFGFVARKQGSATDNVCHLFAEHDPQQPASAIVNFVSRVMIGSQKSK